jgi:hypothetical protein
VFVWDTLRVMATRASVENARRSEDFTKHVETFMLKMKRLYVHLLMILRCVDLSTIFPNASTIAASVVALCGARCFTVRPPMQTNNGYTSSCEADAGADAGASRDAQARRSRRLDPARQSSRRAADNSAISR